jgi:hypothetical protein
MPNVKISVAYDAEKLAAIRRFAPGEAAKLEAELAAAADKIFRRAVPSAVRDYIEGKAADAGKTGGNGP